MLDISEQTMRWNIFFEKIDIFYSHEFETMAWPEALWGVENETKTILIFCPRTKDIVVVLKANQL